MTTANRMVQSITAYPDVDGDGDPETSDCDDLDPSVYAGAPEACDAVDSDCDGDLVDEFDDTDGDLEPDCTDPDDDGDGDPDVTDCNDVDVAVFTGAPEACDAVDSDCDGDLVDEGFDTDGDGVTTCAGDCDDGDPSVRPGFFEACDGVDSNCDGIVINEDDYDGDGYPSCGDCDDSDSTIHPLAVEVCDNVDQDCDTIVDEEGGEDLDGDGLMGGGCGGDCDDGRIGPCEVVQLDVAYQVCAVLDTGAVQCWGSGSAWRLPYGSLQHIGDDEPAFAPGPAFLGGPVVQVAMGWGGHGCALMATGAVRCWGNGSAGQLGYGMPETVGDDETVVSMGEVDVGGPVVQLAAGSSHTCAVLDGGSVRCWGNGGLGRLGYGNTDYVGRTSAPATAGDVDVGGSVLQVASGNVHTCALLDGGTVRCWGASQNGLLGYANPEDVGDDESPASAGDVDVGGTVVQLAAGSLHTCALLDAGNVRCWGYGADGRLGYGDTENVGVWEVPAEAGDVDVGGVVVQIAAGKKHTCAVLDDGAVRCWGYGEGGRLGYGNEENIGDDEAPATAGDVPLDGPATAISVHESTCALMTDGAVRCWGPADDGSLGYGNLQDIGDNETPASAGWVPVSLPLFP